MASQPNSIELLAPAGKWETMIEVLAAGADAVYLGGKRYNMRLLRADQNFSDTELEAAVSYTHERKKKIYVTVNNLFYQDEIIALEEYLQFLAAIGVDAVIVQDLAVAGLVKRSVPQLALHASVQMGVANSAAANWLQTQGFTRAILSKNVLLPEIEAIHQRTSLELEYFIHGDVCISHTGQCYLSAMIFGASGNRGCCKKPCRWQYNIKGNREHQAGYYLAHHDLCLIEHIPELLAAGVVSLKIEGRMRDAQYLSQVINAYRQVLDNTDPAAVVASKNSLQSSRVRDFTTAGFTHHTTLVDIGLTGEREPVFPTAPIEILPQQTISYKLSPETVVKTKLQVQIGDLEALAMALATGVKTIVVGGMSNYPLTNLDLSKAVTLTSQAGAELVYQLPRVVAEAQLAIIDAHLEYLASSNISTVLVSDLGSRQLALNRGFRVWGDYSLNLTNAEAIALLGSDTGFERVTAALELSGLELSSMVPVSSLPVDIVAHGWLPGMITDLCLRGAVDEGCPQSQTAVSPLALIDQAGNHYPLGCDQECHHYVYYPYKLSLLGHLTRLNKVGVNGLRLDLTEYTPEQVFAVINIYQKALLAKADEQLQLQQDLAALTGLQYTDAPFCLPAEDEKRCGK